MRIILASSSPRRHSLLKAAGFEPKVFSPHVDETLKPDEKPDVYVQRLAREKASFVSRESQLVVVAADTVVVLDCEILGKPENDSVARKMLRILSDREHKVLTGYCVRYEDQEEVNVVTTSVSFRNLSSLEIDRYLITRESRDKAGAYAIQGLAAPFVDRIEGSFTNVIGLPLKEVIESIYRICPQRVGR